MEASTLSHGLCLQAPKREHIEDRVHEIRLQLIEIPVNGYQRVFERP